MKKIISNFYSLLNSREKNGLTKTIFLALFSSFLEITTIYIIYSWLNGSLVKENNFISDLPAYLLVIIICISGIVRVIALLYNNKFALSKEHSFSILAVKNIVNSDYNLINQLGEGTLLKRSMVDGSILAYEILLPLISLINGITLVVFLITGMIYISPVLSISIIIVISSLYLFYNKIIKSKINSFSIQRNESNQEKFHIASEIFKAILELKLFNIVESFISRLSIQTKIHSSSRINLLNYTHGPRIVFESLLFISMFVAISLQPENIVKLIPILTALLAIAIKLIPAIQNIFTAKNQLKFAEGSLNDFIRLKEMCDENQTIKGSYEFIERKFESLKVKNLIIGYNNFKLIEIPTFEINKGDRFILHGKSGSGKSTFLKVLAGLTMANYDTVTLNGYNSDFRDFASKVAFLPQKPSLFAGTLLENITLKFDNKISSEDRLNAISIAESLNLFKSGNLTIDSYIKPSSSNISGGQSQRIALARALYFKKEILLLDEPTSALDDHDENAVVAALNSLSNVLTIIIISHRNLEGVKIAKRFSISNKKLNRL